MAMPIVLIVITLKIDKIYPLVTIFDNNEPGAYWMFYPEKQVNALYP
jgi:hypothetical protein